MERWCGTAAKLFYGMKKLLGILLLLTTAAFGQQFPIKNGVLQSDLNAAHFKILSANLSDYAGSNMSWNAVTNKFDATGGGGGVTNPIIISVTGAGHTYDGKIEAVVGSPLTIQGRVDGGAWSPGLQMQSDGKIRPLNGDIDFVVASGYAQDWFSTGGDGSHPNRVGMFNDSTPSVPGIGFANNAEIWWDAGSTWSLLRGDTGLLRAAAAVVKVRNLLQLVPTSAPGSPVEGMLYGDSSTHKVYYRDNSGWVDLTTGGGGGGNVSNSGTPTTGQYARWTDATHIEGVATSTVKSDLSLNNVTNDAQTKASVMPNTAPSSGQIPVGNAGGTAYVPQTLSGSGVTATLSSAGVLTLSAIPNATLSNSSITIAGTSTALGGSITQDTITGLSTTGLVSRTAANTLGIVTDNSSNWNTAFTDRLKWDGGSTGLTAATGRTSLGGTTVGQNIFTLTNPSAITFLRINADNSVTAQTAANFKSDLSLNNVTNDAQTQAAVVPNTAPSSGQILVGNAGGTAYAKQTLSGSGATATLSSAGVLTLSSIANATLSNSAITIAGTSTSLGGSITQDTITGLSTTGWVKRTAANTLGIVAPGTGVETWVTTPSSANLFTAMTDETGSGGSLVFATGPTLTNPVVGTQAAQDNSTKAASTAYVDKAGPWDGEAKVSGSNYTNATTSLTDVTGLTTGTLTTATLYEFQVLLQCNSSSTAGMQVAITQTGSGTGGRTTWSGSATNAAATGVAIGSNASGTAGPACVLVNGDGEIIFAGHVFTSSAGTAGFKVQALKATSGTATIYIGSSIRWRKS